MKKQNIKILIILGGLFIFNIPLDVFALNAQCSAKGIDATRWELTEKQDFTEDDFDLGYAKRVCCEKGNNYIGKYEACDYYQLKEGVEPEIDDSSDINLDKVVTDESSAVSCGSDVDLSNFVFDYTIGEIDRPTDPSSQSENRITCCKQVASSYLNGGVPKWSCTYYVKKELVDEGYQTAVDKAEEEKEQAEREDLEDLRGDLDANCDSMFDSEAQELIQRLFNIICIAVPILLIVLGSVDFGNAVLSSDQEAMQKAVKRFTTRCIIAVAIFFLPLIVNLLFSFPGLDIVAEEFFCDV